MPDNVVVSPAALTVASKAIGATVATEVQHQRIIPETLLSGIPMDVSDTRPVPVTNEMLFVVLTELLAEQRVSNSLLFDLLNPASETLDTMREAARKVPVS